MGKKKQRSLKKKAALKKMQINQCEQHLENFKTPKISQHELEQLNPSIAHQLMKTAKTYELEKSPIQFIEIVKVLERLLLVILLVILVLVELSVGLYELIHTGKWSLPLLDQQLINWFSIVVHYCFTKGG